MVEEKALSVVRNGGEIQEIPPPAALTVQELKFRVQRVQEVMRSVMKEGTHYGKIPGTGDKPTLLSAGADLLAMTFQIALATEAFKAADDEDEVTYVVKMRATHQVSGAFLGSSEGICSTREKKYRWRRPVHINEFNDADPERRTYQYGNKGEKWERVRQEPGDVENTILQMAIKRAKVSTVRIVTACSDIFAQNLEDMPEHLREDEARDGVNPAEPSRASARKAAAAAAPLVICSCDAAENPHTWTPAPGGPCPERPVNGSGDAPAPAPARAPAQAPVPAAPAAATQAEPSENGPTEPTSIPGENSDGTLRPLTVQEVKKVKSGVSDRGPWSLHAVKTNEGEFVTFSTTHATVCEQAQKQAKRILIRSKDNGKKSREITEAALVP